MRNTDLRSWSDSWATGYSLKVVRSRVLRNWWDGALQANSKSQAIKLSGVFMYLFRQQILRLGLHLTIGLHLGCKIQLCLLWCWIILHQTVDLPLRWTCLVFGLSQFCLRHLCAIFRTDLYQWWWGECQVIPLSPLNSLEYVTLSMCWWWLFKRCTSLRSLWCQAGRILQWAVMSAWRWCKFCENSDQHTLLSHTPFTLCSCVCVCVESVCRYTDVSGVNNCLSCKFVHLSRPLIFLHGWTAGFHRSPAKFNSRSKVWVSG